MKTVSVQPNYNVELRSQVVADARSGPLRVPVVDDSPFSRKLLEHALR